MGRQAFPPPCAGIDGTGTSPKSEKDEESFFLLPESLVRRSGAIFISSSSSSLIFHPFLGMCPLAIIGLWASGEKA